MTIEGEYYRITPINEHSNFFDLELLYEINGKNPRKEYKIVAYGVTLESAINRIIRYSISKKYKDKSITLKDYVESYKEESEKIRCSFK